TGLDINDDIVGSNRRTERLSSRDEPKRSGCERTRAFLGQSSLLSPWSSLSSPWSSLSPSWFAALKVIFPNIPSISWLGPAVKKRAWLDKPCAPLPKTRDHRPSMMIGSPFLSFICPTKAPVGREYALIAPSPKLPTISLWLNGPNSSG